MKLIGNFIDSSISKLTLDLFELFCIPIINIRNKVKLNNIENKDFFRGNIMNLFYVD